MRILLSLVTKLIALVAALHAKANAATDALSESQALLADMKAKLDADNADHAALIQRADDAAAKSVELQSLDDAATVQSADVAAVLNAEPAVPSVDPTTFQVTAPATGTANDLSFRDRQAETDGTAAPLPTVVPPPATPAPAPADSTPPPAAA